MGKPGKRGHYQTTQGLNATSDRGRLGGHRKPLPSAPGLPRSLPVPPVGPLREGLPMLALPLFPLFPGLSVTMRHEGRQHGGMHCPRCRQRASGRQQVQGDCLADHGPALRAWPGRVLVAGGRPISHHRGGPSLVGEEETRSCSGNIAAGSVHGRRHEARPSS
jgi:hypothetical protein